MSIWDEYIGPLPWRTLIAFESWALRNSESPNPTNPPLYPEWPKEQNQHLYVYPVPDLPTAVIVHAGREFLVGTPSGILDALKEQRPQNVILLSWEEEHTKDLISYCQEFSANRPLTIWTSDWIWEHVQHLAQAQNYPALLSATRLKLPGQPEEDETSDTQTQEGPKINYVAFEEHYTEFSAPQVELSMYYEVGATCPRLHAQFRLFGSRLTVRLGQSKKWDRPPTTGEYQNECLLPIYEQFPNAREALRTVVEQRLRELTEASLLTTARNGFTSVPQHIFSVPDEYYRYTVETCILEHLSDNSISVVTNVDLCPPELRDERALGKPFDTPQEWNKKNVLNLDSSLPLCPAKPNPLQENAQLMEKPRIYLAIACGGMSTRSGGQIIPIRRVLLGDQNKINISLLGMKVLDFLLDQAKKEEDRIFENTLILIPSPWTEASVREEMARLLWEYRHLWEQSNNPPRILYLHQTVILPRYQESNGRLAYYRHPEGLEFQYSHTGHFNFLSTLFEKTVREQLEGFDDRALIYYSNYNNLGRNINRDVLRLANHLLTQESCPMLFELTRHVGEDGRPKDQGSYWVSACNSSRLLKPVYCGRDGSNWNEDRDRIVDPSQLNELYMSTGSFLLYPRRLQDSSKDFQEKVKFYIHHRPTLVYSRRRSGGTASLPDTLQFERDMDEITWALDSCQGVSVDGLGEATRFFPIKEEKDLYQDKYGRLNDLYKDIVDKIGATSGDIPSDSPLALEPVENYQVWGGDRIRFEKGLPPSEDQVSETWEGSAHPKGVSGIRRNALHSVPLTSVISSGEVDVMAKFLDCNDWLSIQLHPSKWTCTQINGVLESPARWNSVTKGLSEESKRKLEEELRLREDDEGKEEIFYVLTVSKKEADKSPYSFGLESKEVRNLAGCGNIEPQEWEKFQPDKIRDRVLNQSQLCCLSGLLPNMELPNALTQKYKEQFGQLINDRLCPILKLREGTSPKTLDGIVLILAIHALRESIKALDSSTLDGIIQEVFRSDQSPLLRFFHPLKSLEPGAVIRVRQGVIHAAGPGLYLVEASHQSNNTYRIFDHGREFISEPPRPTHYTLAAVALSDESFLDAETERRHILPQWTSDSSIGNIRLEVLKSTDLTHWHELKIEPENGHVVLCTKGRIRVRTTYGRQDEAPRLWREIELPTAHAAYIPPPKIGQKRKMQVKTVGFYESSGIDICAKSKPIPPALCITLGGTHFQFIYDAPPEPRRYAIYLWHEVLNNPWDTNNWNLRLDALKEKLGEFLGMYHKKNEMIEFLGLSWPGFFNDNQTRLYSNILGCEGVDTINLVANLENCVSSGPPRVLFDATADIWAEVLDAAGYLRVRDKDTIRLRSGMLLNFASGVCLGIYDASADKVKESLGDIPIAHLGRLMWFDPAKREWHLDSNWRVDTVINDINQLDDQPPPVNLPEDVKKRVIRFSEFLSTTAVAFRFLWKVYQHDRNHDADRVTVHDESIRDLPSDAQGKLEECMGRAQEPLSSVDERAQKFGQLIREYRPLLNAIARPLFDWMARTAQSQETNNPDEMRRRKWCRDFIETIATTTPI